MFNALERETPTSIGGGVCHICKSKIRKRGGKVPKAVEKAVCCCCGESLSVTKFYKSYSNFYKDEHLPICKDCFQRKFGQFATEYHSNKKAIQRLCMAFDIYFNEELFDGCDTNDETVVGNYFRKLNMAQFKRERKTFENSITEGVLELSGDRKKVKGKRIAVVDEYDNVQEEEIKINPKDIEKWGTGFDLTDYEALNTHYKHLKKANPNSDDNQEIFIIDMCYTKMQQMKAAREGRVDDYNKLTDSYRKSFQQSGLKMVRESGSTEDFIIGINAETIEKFTPAEYYKNKKLYKDHDNIGDYIRRFLFRPLKNLIFGTQERDPEYCVKDEEETDGFTDEE